MRAAASVDLGSNRTLAVRCTEDGSEPITDLFTVGGEQKFAENILNVGVGFSTAKRASQRPKTTAFCHCRSALDSRCCFFSFRTLAGNACDQPYLSVQT